MLFIPWDNWKALFFKQTYRYREIWWAFYDVVFYETSVFKEVHILYTGAEEFFRDIFLFKSYTQMFMRKYLL